MPHFFIGRTQHCYIVTLDDPDGKVSFQVRSSDSQHQGNQMKPTPESIVLQLIESASSPKQLPEFLIATAEWLKKYHEIFRGPAVKPVEKHVEKPLHARSRGPMSLEQRMKISRSSRARWAIIRKQKQQ